MSMGVIHSKVTAQGQISVPAEVRRQLGIGPGSVLVWEQREGAFVGRRHVFRQAGERRFRFARGGEGGGSGLIAHGVGPSPHSYRRV